MPRTARLIDNDMADHVAQEIMDRLGVDRLEDEFECLEEYMCEITTHARSLESNC